MEKTSKTLNKNIKLLIIMVVSIGVLIGMSPKRGEGQKIGVLQWGEHPALIDSYEGMRVVIERDNPNIEIIYKNAFEDVGNASMILSQFKAEGVSVVYAIATPSAQLAKQMLQDSGIPIIFNAVSDPVASKLVQNIAVPEANISGVSDLPPLKKQLELIREIQPDAKKIGVMSNLSESNSMTQVNELKMMAPEFNFEIVDAGVGQVQDISMIATQLINKTDALFIVNDNMIAGAARLLVETAARVGKPVYMAEVGQLDQGILASDSVSYLKLGEEAGAMILEIMKNHREIRDLPILFSENTDVYLNEEQAQKLNIEFPNSVRKGAIIK